MAVGKIGRPTDAPKKNELKFRADDRTAEMLKECSERLGVSQAEVLRQGVNKIHADIQKEEGK